MAIPGKVTTCITYDQQFHLYTWDTLAQGNTNKRTFFSAFHVIAKKWKQATWPSGVKWANKMGIIYTMPPCIAVNMSELDLYHLHR